MGCYKHEVFGIHRTTLLFIVASIVFGSFSIYQALGVGRTERSEVRAVTAPVSGTAPAAGEDVAVKNTKPIASATRRTNASRTAVKTDVIPIEKIQVGDRVLAESPTGEEDTAFGSDIIPSDWRKLTLRAPKRDGTVAEVVLLRPLTWLNEQRTGRSRLPSGIFAARRTDVRHLSDELGTDSGTTGALHGRDTSRNPARQAGPTVESQTVEDMVGGTVLISVPECGIDGNANVLAIDSCPEIPSGAGRVVTGTFLHQARSTITLTIAGQTEPIECTGNHPFWSEDRQAFVRADSLQPNETLRTATGLTNVESWTPELSSTPVYNIEVHGAHVYHVGASGVVVHNGTGLPCPELDSGRFVFREISSADRARLVSGLGLIAKGTGGIIADQVAGQSTRYISAAEIAAGTERFRGGNGLIMIDVEKAIEMGAGFVDHKNVLQAVARDGLPRNLQNAMRAFEVLFKDRIPFEAIIPLY